MRRIDSAAVEMIPIRLIISIAIIAAIVVLILAASGSLRVTFAEHDVEQECRMLQSALVTMVSSGVPRDLTQNHAAEGTKRVQMFTLPASILYLCFGGDPDPFNTGVLSSGLTEAGSVICYKVDGGSKQTLWLLKDAIKFRAGEYVDDTWVIDTKESSYIVLGGGKTTLVFEYVKQNNVSFILIYGTEGNS